MPKSIVTIIKDSRKKADIIIGPGGIITVNKNLTVRIDDNDQSPCKATKLFIQKMKFGDNEVIEEK